MMHPASKFSRLRSACRRGFSLIEVVVAVGIFAIAIVSVIGLLGPINKTVSDVRDFDDASRVVTAIQSQLQRAGFTNVVGYLSPGNVIYASRDGQKVALDNAAIWNTDASGQGLTDTNGNGATTDERDAQKFFAVGLTRNTDLSDVGNDTTAGFLAFTITLRWPAYSADGTPFSDTTQQSVMVIPAAITR